MKKFVLSTITGAFVFFVWNAVSWMVLPFHSNQLNTLPESAVVALKGETNEVESGIYHYPGLQDPNLTQKISDGPRIPFMVYVAEGTSVFDPIDFLKSMIFNLFSAGLLLFALSKISDHSIKNVVSVCIVIALLVGFASDLPQTSWFMFPIHYAIVNMIDYLVSFVLAGLAMRKLAL